MFFCSAAVRCRISSLMVFQDMLMPESERRHLRLSGQCVRVRSRDVIFNLPGFPPGRRTSASTWREFSVIACFKNIVYNRGAQIQSSWFYRRARFSVLQGRRRLHPGSRVSRGTHFLPGRTENLAGLQLWRTGFGHPGLDQF